MKVLLVISYDGSKFHGFQRQKNVRNVQGYLEESLSNILEEKVIVKGAGRTDAGVHAYCQVVHFDTDKNIIGLKHKLNNHLIDMRVKKLKKVKNNFHARHSVKNKIYLYKVDLSNSKDTNYYLRVNNKLNIKKMKDASKLFLGTHDFENFVAGFRDNYISTIISIKIYKIGKTLYFKFKGYGFYRYMVRNMVGSLLEVGKDKIEKNVIESMLSDKNDKRRLPTSSPNGLYLYKINY